MDKLRFKKLHADVVTPRRGHPTDAGLDVFWCPTPDQAPFVQLHPGESHIFPTGCAFEVPPGYALLVCNRSSLGSKGIVYGAHLIDPGYAGEVFINLHNISGEPYRFMKGDKIAQLVLLPVLTPELVEVSTIYHEGTSRGSGALGSTGK